MSEIHVRLADWQKDNADLRRIRETVFIAEQAVPPELEWDAEDADAVHFLALEGDYPVGTARQIGDDKPDARIELARVPFNLGNHPPFPGP